MARIVVSEFMDEDFLRAGLAGFDLLYDPGLVDDPAALIAAASTADGLIVRNRTQVRAGLLDAAPRLKVVGRLGVGLDNIDVADCEARGVAVFPAVGANNVSVAEYVIASAMLLLRGAYGSTSLLVEGRWPRNALSSGREIFGKRLGLIGFGSIARETGRRAAALGMTIAAHDPFLAADDPAWLSLAEPVEPLSIAELLTSSDVVSLHVPLTPDTRRMIGAQALSMMKTDAILINTARGGIVDEEAVADALQGERLGGAALDVFEAEPLNGEDADRFADTPNLILTPHVAGLSVEANVRVSKVTVEAVRKHLTER